MKLKQILLLFALLTASCLASFSLFAQAPTAGLVAYFKLNGNTTNSTATAITASAIGTSYTTNNAGQANSAIQFAGNTGSYVDITDNGNLDFNGNFTVSFGFFFNGSTTGGLFDNCLNYNGYGIWLWSTVAGTWNLQFNYKGNSVGSAASTAFSLNKWHSVAAVHNAGTISLYIDGVFRLSGTAGTGTPSYPINAIMGAMAFSSFTPPRYNPLNGKMDELRIYNRALTAAEISILSPIILPLRLGNFTALKQTDGVRLNWDTESEENSNRFEIETSRDGSLFFKTGELPAKGQSATKQYYSWTDHNPLSGTRYYRLKMIDNDGAFTYSRIIAVQGEAITGIRLFPNPATDVLQVQIPSAETQDALITVTDFSGKTVMQKNFNLQSGNNAISFPVYSLSAGSYYLSVITANGRTDKPFLKK